MSFDMDALPLAQKSTAGLAQNECYPEILINDPSFALINSDPYFLPNRRPDPRWANAPDPTLINGRAPPFPRQRKRDLSYLDPALFVFENDTMSRKPTRKELEEVTAQLEYAEALRVLDAQAEELAFVECRGDSCATQLTPLVRYVACSVHGDPRSLTDNGRASVTLPTPAKTVPSMTEATVTAAEPLITEVIYPSW